MGNGEIVFVSKLGFGVDSDDEALSHENIHSFLAGYSPEWLQERIHLFSAPSWLDFIDHREWHSGIGTRR